MNEVKELIWTIAGVGALAGVGIGWFLVWYWTRRMKKIVTRYEAHVELLIDDDKLQKL